MYLDSVMPVTFNSVQLFQEMGFKINTHHILIRLLKSDEVSVGRQRSSNLVEVLRLWHTGVLLPANKKCELYKKGTEIYDVT